MVTPICLAFSFQAFRRHVGMGNSGRTGRYSEDAVSTRCGFFRLFLFFSVSATFLFSASSTQTEKFFFVLCVDQALAEIVVHQQDAQTPQNVQMDIVLRVRRGDQEEQFGRFAVQGVKVRRRRGRRSRQGPRF